MLTALDSLTRNTPPGFTVEVDNRYKDWDSPGNAYFIMSGGISHGPYNQDGAAHLIRNLNRGCTFPRQVSGPPPAMVSTDVLVDRYLQYATDVVLSKYPHLNPKNYRMPYKGDPEIKTILDIAGRRLAAQRERLTARG